VFGQSQEDISDCKVLSTFLCQPNFGQNRLKPRKIATNLSYMWCSTIGTFRTPSL